MAIYGSFNIRSLFSKGYEPEDFYNLFNLFEKVYYYETFMAIGDSNTINTDNIGPEFFDELPDKIKQSLKSWNEHVYNLSMTDIVEST